MKKRGTFLATLIVAAAVFLAIWGNAFAPIDNGLSDLRFDADQRAPSGTIVLAEIDSQSLAQVGVWPWPRAVYARLLDKLFAMGASDVALDIDFSSRSDPEDDSKFEAALARAGGYATLAAFRQYSADGRLAINLPLPRFLAQASAATVNVVGSPDGLVRRYAGGMTVAGQYYPSLAAELAGRPNRDDTGFYIDYGINARAIPRVSVADILSGRVEATQIAGKHVVVGASAEELRDLMNVPRFGAVSGAILQIMGAETLLQNRALHPVGWALPVVLVLALGALFVAVRGRVRLRTELGLALLAGLCVEGAGLFAQVNYGWISATGPVDAALFGFGAAAVIAELDLKRRQHKRAARERDSVRRILDRVITDNFDGVVVIDDAGMVVAASQLADTMLGRGGAMVGKPARHFLPPAVQLDIADSLGDGPGAGAAPAELDLEIEGQSRTLEYVVTRSSVSEPSRRRTLERSRPVACLTFRDVSERREQDKRVRFLASHDPLTGALSRLTLVQLIQQRLGEDPTRGMTVILIDLGRFRVINDTLGHSHGDLVLKEAVRRLESMDMLGVARVGGDSFAVARRGVLGERAARRLCQSIIASIVEPYHLKAHRAVLSANAGVTSTDISGFDGETLLSHADTALSAAKALPGNTVEVFNAEMDQRLADSQAMEIALQEALARNQFSVVYQPQIRLETGALVGVEALVRWHHPVLGHVSPDKFVPAAEESGLIVDIGRFVLETACREVATWPEDIHLAVNVSPVQFELGDVVGDVRAALGATRLAPNRLDLEITEGVFVAKAEPVIAALQRLRTRGIGVALDDFGTGYSSLSYLGRLPIDKIKIDQSFVRNLPRDRHALAIVGAVTTLAHSLGKIVVVEGLETPDQVRLLADLGCQIGQGYYFGKPMTGPQMRALMAPETQRKIAG